MKETKETCQLNVIHDSILDNFAVKGINETTGKTWSLRMRWQNKATLISDFEGCIVVIQDFRRIVTFKRVTHQSKDDGTPF